MRRQLPRLARTGAVLAAAVLLLAATSSAATAATWNHETLDGDRDTDGRTTNNVGYTTSSVVWNGTPHVWYPDLTTLDLRHAWWTGTAWNFATLDGDSTVGGRTTNSVGKFNVATVWAGTPHVWYLDDTAKDLRHAWWTGTAWNYETLDGDVATGGRTTNQVGSSNAVAVWAGTPHVWYHDATAGDLRHAWWTGSVWNYETLDGDRTVGGRTTDTVGLSNAATVWNGTPHVWYRNGTAADLRHAWWTGTAWNYETLDGDVATGGRTTDAVGFNNAVTAWAGTPHVFYRDITAGDLRHAWWTGTAWNYEVLDGDGTVGGRTSNSVGSFNAVTTWAGTPHVFYRDETDRDLRHAWWTGTAWNYEVLDGDGTVGGRTTDSVGGFTTVTEWNGEPHLWHYDDTAFDLRHAWYG